MTKQTDFDRYQEELRKKAWRIEDIPFYEKGKAPDSSKVGKIEWLELKDRIFGRKFGRNGIGKLREVALTKITEQETLKTHPFFKQDPVYFIGTGVYGMEHPDIEKWQKQQEDYAKMLQENGVKVNWIEFPEPFMGPFGPLRFTWAASELMITRGGIITPKGGWHPIENWGRAEYLSRWAFWHLNIPVLLAITGKAACEANPVSHFLAEDVMIVGLSAACNEEGFNQLVPAVKRTSGVEDFKVMVNKMPLDTYFDPETGLSAHLDMVWHAVDAGKVLLYPPSINTDILHWLKENKFEVITVDREEQIQYLPCNLILLEPGKVLVHEGATRTISKLKKAGIEVTEVAFSETLKFASGMHCATMEVYREPGPLLKDIIS